MQSNDRSRVQTTPLHIPDGTYRIKNKTADVYLTCPQDAAIIVDVRKSDQYSDSQKVRYPLSWLTDSTCLITRSCSGLLPMLKTEHTGL